MSLKQKLKNTPLRQIYWHIIDFWPIRKVRSFVGAKRRDHLLDVTLPAYYRNLAGKPVDEKKVIFLEYRSETLSDSFRLLWDKLETDYDFDLHFHNLNHSFVKHKEYVHRCKELLDDLADARYVFVNDANEVISCLPLREETVVTQTWHACGAFKKWGMSTAEKIFGADAKNLERHPNYANLSYVTVSSPEIIWAYAEAMNLKGREQIIRPVGVSRTDVFFDRARKEAAAAKLKALFPASEGKQIILYAPTFRGRVKYAKAPDEIDYRKFAKALSDRYVMVVKHHPFVRELPAVPAELNGKFVMDLSKKMEIEELLMVSDVCISDYSSLVFEYSLMRRPMLFFAYDLEDYFDWRGFYYPYEELAPGPIVKTDDALLAQIEKLSQGFDPSRVDAFRERFMSACDGKATERILELTFADALKKYKKQSAAVK